MVTSRNEHPTHRKEVSIRTHQGETMNETLRKKIEEKAEEYSNIQFALAETRTVSSYCNTETFTTAFEAGASFASRLLMVEVEKLVDALELIQKDTECKCNHDVYACEALSVWNNFIGGHE